MSQIPGLTDHEVQSLVATERVNSVVSILAILFVVITYVFVPGFNKPINRLIFFACFGNLGSNVAALISEIGPFAGSTAPVCKFQAFLVQMFLGVDCYWALCMAVNVYLVFFRGYTVQQLRSLDLAYLLICYGLSFIPAVVFILISTKANGPVYGPATIWCWITIEWDYLRFVFLYGIVWVAILLAIIIYARAAKVIWDKREHLDGFLNPLNENPFINTVTTEVVITTEDRPIVSKPEHETPTFEEFATPDIDNPYTVDVQVTVHSGKRERPLPSALRMRSLTRQVAKHETNADAWLYARVAFLFFVALLITWVPSSINRIYACIYPSHTNFGLNYAASFVFPLQAFWNTIVYIITSQSACRDLLSYLPFIRRSPSPSSSSPSCSRQSTPSPLSDRKQASSPSPSQIKLTKPRGVHLRCQKHSMGKPRRLGSNEQMSSSSSVADADYSATEIEIGEEQELQNF